ncbi:MAG: hypothetical protein QOJ29_3842 [Thermoleophilaceae bacterium]|nr:hypothetical protein [Thermoleophilaceae bacterium]
MTFLDRDSLDTLGLSSVGTNVQIDEAARLIGTERMTIGSNVRIDAFAVLSAGADGLVIGDCVHVAVFCFLAGAARIELGDFSGLSRGVSIYSSNDDYSGHSLTGPMVPDELRSVDTRPVRIGRHVIVGAGSVVLPGVTIGDGAAVGALSLVRSDLPAGTIAAGQPARIVGQRDDRIYELEQQVRAPEL